MTRSCRGLLAATLALAPLLAMQAHAQSVPIVGGVAAVETFDSLAAAGTGAALPTGWFFSETGSNANTTYAADDGSTNSGNTYSYGQAGSTERALGGLLSGSLTPTFGARLVNQTGAALTGILVQYTGEQWRLGTAGREDRLDFQFSLDATSLTTGTWTDVNALDFIAPINAGALGALNGNLPANRRLVSGSIDGISLPAGATLWVRWSDFNAASSDDGLAIDDVSFAVPGDFPPQVIASSPLQGANGVPVSSLVTITFSEAIVIADSAGIVLDCGAGTPAINAVADASTLTVTPAGPLPYGAACELTIAAAAINDIDGSPDPMDAPFLLSFNTLVDLPPTLLSSTPVNGAIDFPANANLQLTFSEPVTLGADWFVLACTVSGTIGPLDSTVGGGPSAFSINPVSDLLQGESCVLTLNAAQITDQDGTPDPLAGPASIAFTVAAPIVNQPPVVLSTTPMDGDDTFPPAGNLVVLFNEPVTLAPGAFSLDCTVSTGIVLDHAASGTSFSIGTGTALVAEDACTFTIHASLVSDSEGATLAADVVVAFFVASSSVGNYYSQVNTSSPEQLRCSLHATIRGHTEYPYGWDQLDIADQDPTNSSRILDIYRNCSFRPGPAGDRVGGSGSGATCGTVQGVRYNREHVWPRSLGFSTTTLAAHNDLHMLHLSDEGFNADRGNKPYDYCPQSSGCLENPTVAYAGQGGGNGTYPGNSNWYSTATGSAGSYEVWPKLRGNMARALFYMAIRYEGGDNLPNLELTNNRSLIINTPSSASHAYMGILSTLLEWHLQDPVDARELERNQVVQSFQGNRNPFVDHPEWATLALFTSSQPAECQLGGANTAPVAADDNYLFDEDSLLQVSALLGVLANDTDADGDTLTAVLVANAMHGALALASDGSFSYQPNADYCGNDGFTYRANDGQASSAVAIVSLAIACINDAPVAFGDSYQLDEDSLLEVSALLGVLANDSDVDGDALSAVLVANAMHGVLALASDGSFSYQPHVDYCGSDSFTYRAHDGQLSSSEATVSLAIACINDAPVLIGNVDDIGLQEGVAMAPVDLSLMFADVDDDPLSYAASGLPAGLVLDPLTGMLAGTPALGSAAESPYTVEVTATDPQQASAVLQLGITVGIEPPLLPGIFADGFEN
jgi:VCBS repeat-containing protein